MIIEELCLRHSLPILDVPVWTKGFGKQYISRLTICGSEALARKNVTDFVGKILRTSCS